MAITIATRNRPIVKDTKQSSKGCLVGWLVNIIDDTQPSNTRDRSLPYRGRDYLFTKGERAYYDVLSTAIPEGYLHLAKVRLADLVYLPKDTQRRRYFFNRVSSKYVDFVICNTRKVGQKLVIELDDRSHQRSDRATRGAFANEMLPKANIPILHVKAAQTYQQQQVASAVSASLLQQTGDLVP